MGVISVLARMLWELDAPGDGRDYPLGMWALGNGCCWDRHSYRLGVRALANGFSWGWALLSLKYMCSGKCMVLSRRKQVMLKTTNNRQESLDYDSSDPDDVPL